MNRLSSYVLAIAVCLGAAATFASNRQLSTGRIDGDFHQATEAAFRDGLYMGKLEAERGSSRIPMGRWSREKDRSYFVAGYRQGHRELVANRAAVAGVAIPAE
jgi:hypothetical protein